VKQFVFCSQSYFGLLPSLDAFFIAWRLGKSGLDEYVLGNWISIELLYFGRIIWKLRPSRADGILWPAFANAVPL